MDFPICQTAFNIPGVTAITLKSRFVSITECLQDADILYHRSSFRRVRSPLTSSYMKPLLRMRHQYVHTHQWWDSMLSNSSIDLINVDVEQLMRQNLIDVDIKKNASRLVRQNWTADSGVFFPPKSSSWGSAVKDLLSEQERFNKQWKRSRL